MLGAPIGVDDEVGLETGIGRLDQNVGAPGRTGAARRLADHPAHGVAGGDRAVSDNVSPSCSMMSVTCPTAA